MRRFDYRIVVEWSEGDHAFVARVPAFPSLSAQSGTAPQAVWEAQLAVEAMLEAMADSGETVPPSDVVRPFRPF